MPLILVFRLMVYILGKVIKLALKTIISILITNKGATITPKFIFIVLYLINNYNRRKYQSVSHKILRA